MTEALLYELASLFYTEAAHTQDGEEHRRLEAIGDELFAKSVLFELEAS